jgi:hypothetical protein
MVSPYAYNTKLTVSHSRRSLLVSNTTMLATTALGKMAAEKKYWICNTRRLVLPYANVSHDAGNLVKCIIAGD